MNLREEVIMPNELNADIQAYKKEVGMMNLEKLIAAREAVSTKTFPIPVQELLQRFEQLYTGAISDVLREFALLDQALPGHLKPLRPERTVAGLAFTVKSAPNVKITGERSFRPQMLAELPVGCRHDLVTVLFEEESGEISILLVIFDEENGATHKERGSENENVLPTPAWLSTQMDPPSRSIKRLQIANPSPVPSC